MRSEKGFSLLEVLIAMAIVGVVSVGFLSALTASTKAAVSIDNIDTGRAIAQSQMEYVKQQAFQSSGIYQTNTVLMEGYPGYSVSISPASDVPQRDAFIQKIVVTVSYAGNVIAQLEDCKVKR